MPSSPYDPRSNVMMNYIDFLSSTHRKTSRDYLARVNDPEFPKAKAAELAIQWGFDYWDGDRRICYGGYHYREGYWTPVADALISHYQLKPGDRVLDIGCGKAFLLYELWKRLPGLHVFGLDLSTYALQHAKLEVQPYLIEGCASALPFANQSFDFVFSINTLHNLPNYRLAAALREMQRVTKRHAYLCVESFRNEQEKANLLYWQVTCRAFCSPEEWQWWFQQTGYSGDYSFIYFE